MKVMKRIILAMFPITTLPTISFGSLTFDFNKNFDEQLPSLSDCSRLMELENRENLNLEEWAEGHLIHQLVLQINEQPLDYCMEMTSMDFLVDRQDR